MCNPVLIRALNISCTKYNKAQEQSLLDHIIPHRLTLLFKLDSYTTEANIAFHAYLNIWCNLKTYNKNLTLLNTKIRYNILMTNELL